MRTDEVRAKYIAFFEKNDHKTIPSASLVPENDPTTLFTGSGMQSLLPYLLGESHPKGSRLVNSQKCFRSEDIEEVGDNRHTTFFEMLGNWSLGDYFKEDQLRWFFEFLTDDLELQAEKLYVTVFEGDEKNGIPRDTESYKIWKKLFKEKGVKTEGRILYYDAEKNWWSRAGTPENMPAGEPGGPDSEVFYDFGTEHDSSYGEECHPNCECGRFVEIGNSVFMEYIKKEDGSFGELPQKNVDFGGGLERLTAATNDDADVFNIDLFSAIIKKLEEVSGKLYTDKNFQKSFRIIADHLRGAVFMIADGVLPSNTEQGYFIRRLLRRAIVQLRKLSPNIALASFAYSVADSYESQYPHIKDQIREIDQKITLEETKFVVTLERGMKEFKKTFQMSLNGKSLTKGLSPDAVFKLVTTFGFPLELVKEIAGEQGLYVDEAAHEKRMQHHQKISRAGAEGKFKGGLADASEETTMLHTATHLMLAGLRKFLGEHVHQAGSNITKERTRFDFTHVEKVDRDTLDKVEAYVNEAISKKCDVVIEEMDKNTAMESGVEGSFWERYPDIVNVYTVKCTDGTIYSREICGGPHVTNTGDIKGTFKITKEEASSAGVRRVKAVLL